VGAGLARAFLERGWIARIPDSRALTVTAAGRKKLAELGVADPQSPTHSIVTFLPPNSIQNGGSLKTAMS
jgi:hypothetical protein